MKDTFGKKRKIPVGLQVLFVWIAFIGVVFIASRLWKSAPGGFRETVTVIFDKVTLALGIIILITIVGGLVYSAIKGVRLFRKNREEFRKSPKEAFNEILAVLFLIGLLAVLSIISGWMSDAVDFIWDYLKEAYLALTSL